jgi:hypothetical protein
LLYLLPSLGTAFAQETGAVDISIDGYDGISNISISLLDSNMRNIQNKTVKTDSISFVDVPLNHMYQVLLHYKGVPYTVSVNATQSQSPVHIQVYDPDVSDDNLIITFHHIAITRAVNSLNITEFIQFTNVGNKVKNGTEIKISMPSDFKNFRSSYSCCVQRTDFGFFFTLPAPLFPNGTQNFDILYEISSDSDQYEFSKRQYYDTAFAVLTVSADDLQVVSTDNLQSEGQIDINQRSFYAYSVPNVFAGDGFSVTVTGYGTTESGFNPVWMGTAVLMVVIVVAVVFGFRGKRVTPEKVHAEEDALKSVMAELEKDFTDGKIKEVDYLKMKLKYANRLEKLQLQIHESAKVTKS